MYKISLVFLLLGSIVFSNAQNDKASCMMESDFWTGKILEKKKAEKKKGCKKIRLEFNDVFSNDFIYLNLSNYKRRKLKYQEYQNGKLIIVQEALNKNEQWKEIEYLFLNKEGFPIKQIEKKLQRKERLTSRQHKYSQGEFETKIRFKFTKGKKKYYSNYYLGKINPCQFKAPEDKDQAFIQSEHDIRYKIEFLKSKIDNKQITSNNEIPITRQLISFLIREKYFGEAYGYLEKLKNKPGTYHLTKSIILLSSARHCYTEEDIEKKAILSLAFEEWEKALKYEDSRKEAQDKISQYARHLPKKEDMENPEKSIPVDCWINKSVKLRYKE